jgi:hypothetical protein
MPGMADAQNVLSFQMNVSMERLSIVTVIFLREYSLAV